MTLVLYDLCAQDESRRFSPYCWRIKRALQHKGLSYETVPVPFTKIAEIPGNTTKTVPALKHGETIISDSFLIAEYLDKLAPDAPLLFGSEDVKSLCRFVEAWTYSALHPGIARMVIKDIHDILDDQNKRYFRRSREASMRTTLEEMHAARDELRIAFHKNLLALDMMLRSQPYIGGQAPNFADFIVYGSLKWPAQCSDYELLPPKKRIREWYEKLDS